LIKAEGPPAVRDLGEEGIGGKGEEEKKEDKETGRRGENVCKEQREYKAFVFLVNPSVFYVVRKKQRIEIILTMIFSSEQCGCRKIHV
jgi:hypothetical protein